MSSTPRIVDVLSTDPTKHDIPNKGVADIDQQATLRWELQNFVCEGQYESGLNRILESYLTNQGHEQQLGVWVSGFYGSGKSHLVKVLTHLWGDTELDDGVSARGLAQLSPQIEDSLREISTIGKREAGVFAAAGELQFARPIRRELLAILFQAKGLPEEFSVASCYLWMRDEGILDHVREGVEAAGKEFNRELLAIYVSPVLAQAVIDAMPGYASSPNEVHQKLRAQFPRLSPSDEISDQQMLGTIGDLLRSDGQMPCTLIVLDELQQYIGDDGERALNVQLVTQACTKHFGDKLMFVGTGQSALSATKNLQKIRDRFYLPIELADTDIETVTRKIVLAKKPDRKPEVEALLTECSGEIDRQLHDTMIGPRPEDHGILLADYPILPVRRRFWEHVLRAVDKAGTAGQLRTQLRITHEAVRTLADRDLGAVVPADFIYEQQCTALIQSGVLLPDIHQLILSQDDGTEDGKLKSRLCALCWLIGNLPRDNGADIGVRATPEMLADLLVDDLRVGNGSLRERVPVLLKKLEEERHLMRIDDEYLIQTREGSEWLSVYQQQYSAILNDSSRIAEVRFNLLRTRCGEELQPIRLTHGSSKVPRVVNQHFDDEAPDPDGGAIPVWIRNGWDASEKIVTHEAREAGPESPIIFVFLPQHKNDDLRRNIAEWKAAEATLGLQGVPSTEQGRQALSAMETRKLETKRRVDEVISEIIGEARVFQGGGSEITGVGLGGAVQQAAERALARLYPEFDVADSARWSQVLTRAREGDADCLAVLGHQGEIIDHPVCKAVEDFIGAGKKGREVRSHFMASPYGWSQDAVSGALVALVAGDHLTARENGQSIPLKALDQTKIGVADFRRVSERLTTIQRIALRKLLQEAGFTAASGEETAILPQFLDHMLELADHAGGEPPAPEKPGVVHIRDLQRMTGNELGIAVWEKRERLSQELEEWQARAQLIAQRMPHWAAIEAMLRHVGDLPVAEEIRPQVEALRDGRRLLDEPDPLRPLSDRLSDALREALAERYDLHESIREEGLVQLKASDEWARLANPQRSQILTNEQLNMPQKPEVATEEQLLATLDRTSLAEWDSRIHALPQRVSNALVAAAKELEPEAVPVRLPSRALSTAADVEAYLEEVREKLLSHVNAGRPVVIR